jgi:hypothetical protein
MPVYLTQPLIDSLLEQTDSFLNKAISEWQMLPHEQFSYKASSEKWSANQCIAHLNSYGRYYLPEIAKAINHAKTEQQQASIRFKAGWLGNYFTKMMLTTPDGKPAKKMSSPKDHSPDNSAASHLVIAEFIEQQEQLLKLLRKAKSIDLEKSRIPISIAKFIKLKLGDTFLFLIAHNYRHILQADKALQNAGLRQKKINPFLISEMQLS